MNAKLFCQRKNFLYDLGEEIEESPTLVTLLAERFIDAEPYSPVGAQDLISKSEYVAAKAVDAKYSKASFDKLCKRMNYEELQPVRNAGVHYDIVEGTTPLLAEYAALGKEHSDAKDKAVASVIAAYRHLYASVETSISSQIQ